MILQLSAMLSDVGLNIREAHVFSTLDGYCLDVFVVDGWFTEVGFLTSVNKPFCVGKEVSLKNVAEYIFIFLPYFRAFIVSSHLDDFHFGIDLWFCKVDDLVRD